jgi:chromosome segregation ATPase
MGGLADSPKNRLLLKNLTYQRWLNISDGTRYGYALLARKIVRDGEENPLSHLCIDPEEYIESNRNTRGINVSCGIDVDKLIHKHKTEISTYESKIAKLEEENANLEDQIDDLEEEIEKLKRNQNKNGNIAEITQLKKELAKSQRAYDGLLNELEDEKQDRLADVTNLKHLLKEKDQEITKLKQSSGVAEKDQLIEELHKRIVDLEKRQESVDKIVQYAQESQSAMSNLNDALPTLLKYIPDLAVLKEIVPTLINLNQARQ